MMSRWLQPYPSLKERGEGKKSKGKKQTSWLWDEINSLIALDAITFRKYVSFISVITH